MIAGAAAFAAWVGVSLIVLADGRRGLAAGLGLVAVALAAIAWTAGGAVAAAAILAGGILGAVQRWRAGPPGWDVVPAGSTPRLVLCLVSGLVALWVSTSVMTGNGAPLRFAVLCSVALSAARVLGANHAAATTSVAALVLAIAVAGAVDDLNPTVLPYIAAAMVAAGATWFPRRAVESR